MQDEIVTVTFHCKKEKHWKLKKVLVERQMSVKEGFNLMIDDFIDECEDLKYVSDNLPLYMKIAKEKSVEWNELKRRMQLDEIQNYSGYDPVKKNQRADKR